MVSDLENQHAWPRTDRGGNPDNATGCENTGATVAYYGAASLQREGAPKPAKLN